MKTLRVVLSSCAIATVLFIAAMIVVETDMKLAIFLLVASVAIFLMVDIFAPVGVSAYFPEQAKRTSRRATFYTLDPETWDMDGREIEKRRNKGKMMFVYRDSNGVCHSREER